jgi:hypothetical protein
MDHGHLPSACGMSERAIAVSPSQQDLVLAWLGLQKHLHASSPWEDGYMGDLCSHLQFVALPRNHRIGQYSARRAPPVLRTKGL